MYSVAHFKELWKFDLKTRLKFKGKEVWDLSLLSFLFIYYTIVTFPREVSNSCIICARQDLLITRESILRESTENLDNPLRRLDRSFHPHCDYTNSGDCSVRKTVNYGRLFFRWDARRRYWGIRGYISSFSRALENETVSLAANIDDRQLVALILSNCSFFVISTISERWVRICEFSYHSNAWNVQIVKINGDEDFLVVNSYNFFISVYLFQNANKIRSIVMW